MLGTTEIVIILAIALLVFGPQKLPEIGRQIGAAMRELRKMSGDVQRALEIDDITRFDSPSYGSTYQYNETSEYTPDKAIASYDEGDSSRPADHNSDELNESDEYAPLSGEPAALMSAPDSHAESRHNGDGSVSVIENESGGAFVEPPGPAVSATAEVTASAEAAD